VITIHSPRPEGIPVTFRLEGVRARSASVAGDFNGWSVDAHPMAWDGAGMFADIVLAPGRHEFRYVVDDEWMTDTEAFDTVDNGFGDRNALIDLAIDLTDSAIDAARSGETVTPSPAGVPSDNTELRAIIEDYERQSFDKTFVTAPTTVTCETCGTVLQAERVVVHSLARLEGASDPDDMLAVLAISCSVCAAKGTLVVAYGPTADDLSLALLAQSDDGEPGADPSASSEWAAS
jgi:hypothetical protein